MFTIVSIIRAKNVGTFEPPLFFILKKETKSKMSEKTPDNASDHQQQQPNIREYVIYKLRPKILVYAL